MRKTNKKQTNESSKNTIKKYFLTKTWDTSFRGYTLNQEEIIHRLENNLPIDDLYSKLDSRYKRKNVNDETM